MNCFSHALNITESYKNNSMYAVRVTVTEKDIGNKSEKKQTKEKMRYVFRYRCHLLENSGTKSIPL